MASIKTKGQGRLFQNQVLEALTKTHPGLIIAMYVPASIVSMVYYYMNINASGLTVALVFLAGVFVWTFVEYMLHRYIFHFINDSEWAQKFHYTVHGVHHEYPLDTERLVMPPVPSIFIAAFFFGLFYLVMGTYVYCFLPGFIIGYLAYAMIHYSIHAFKPVKGIQYLWRHHNIHHFQHPDKAFGVSSPLWDYIFRTMPPTKNKEQE